MEIFAAKTFVFRRYREPYLLLHCHCCTCKLPIISRFPVPQKPNLRVLNVGAASWPRAASRRLWRLLQLPPRNALATIFAPSIQLSASTETPSPANARNSPPISADGIPQSGKRARRPLL